MTDRVGQQIGNYRLLRLLGQGIIAEVYLGEHLHLGMQAAIKVLRVHLTNEDSEQLHAEARLIARLVHPHIVRLFDFDVKDGRPFLIMEYAPNGTLRQRHPKGTLVPLDIVVSYVKQLAEALHYVHELGRVHCDIKPENIVIGHNHELLLSDFGLAFTGQSSYSRQTQGMVRTSAYMAPEQIQGHPVPASDQYSLAVVVYEWLSGDWPFSGWTFAEMESQHLLVASPSLRERVPTIPPAVEQVVIRALAKDPQQRFASVKDFALALEEAAKAESSLYLSEAGQRSVSIGDLPRGTVTLLFTDIEGSTHLLQQLGDHYTDMLSECRQLLRAVFQEWSGREVDTQGDAFFVAFARATDAVLAAVDAQRAISNHPWPESVAVRVRMGLHTGEPSLTSEGYVGLDVHRAARIMSAGHGGQVLLSQTSCTLVEQDLPDDVGLRELGEYRLKDLGRPRRLFQLVISDLPANFPALRTLDNFPNNLPVQPTPFLGREKELAVVGDLLHREDIRLVTLTGSGGCGKTRLGLQVAAELSDLFADGVFFVNLAPISDPAYVVPTIVETLGLWEGVGQSLLERLKEELRQKHMLLLLDNFEQVVSAAEQVATLLVACPQLKVLVTSREVLHVRAEHEFVVPPLALPDPKQLPDLTVLSQYASVALFILRAQAVKPDFQMTSANARAIVEICARLDGLPLAIELAAARMKLLTPQALLARLGQRLQVLTGMSRDVPARQQTLRNTIEWSYNLLNEQEQRLFRQLSVFVGGCTLEAVEAVHSALGDGDSAEQILNRVASLIDKSLLQQSEQTVEGQESRLMLLETIREYGLECLTANGEVEIARRVHANYYLALAEEIEPELVGAEDKKWLDQLERENDNLRAALNWLIDCQDVEAFLRLGGALETFWTARGYENEGRQYLERGLTTPAPISSAVRAKALNAAGALALSQYDIDKAEELCREGLKLYRSLGDKGRIARSTYLLGSVAGMRGNFTSARSLLEEATVLFREEGIEWGTGDIFFAMGVIAFDEGKYAQASSLFEESLSVFRKVGNKGSIVYALFQLARVTFTQGNFTKSQALAAECRAFSQEISFKLGIGLALFQLARVTFAQGDSTRARSLAEECLTLCRNEPKDKAGIAYALGLLGQVELYQGNIVMAHSLIEESLGFFKDEVEDRRGLVEALFHLGRVASLQKDSTRARALYEESYVIAKEMGNKLLIASCLEGLASLAATQGETTWGTYLWGAAESLREAIEAPMLPIERDDYMCSVAAARAKLGEKLFAAAWAEGRSMTPDQAFAARGTAISTTIVPDGPHPAKVAISYPAGLTAREVAVLCLVAQGMTNEQVADQLVIRPRTVNTHLTSIYGKIGVSTRSAATRYAMEHHLL